MDAHDEQHESLVFKRPEKAVLCHWHEGKPAVYLCVKCNKPVCEECSGVHDNTVYCRKCKKRKDEPGFWWTVLDRLLDALADRT